MPRKARTTGSPVQAAAVRKKGSKPKAAATDHGRARAEGGKWAKGVSGNPGGRRKEVAEVRDLARQYTEEAMLTLAKIMRSSNERAAAAACNIILDRGWGKAPQALAISGDEDGAPIRHELGVRWMTQDEAAARGWRTA